MHGRLLGCVLLATCAAVSAPGQIVHRRHTIAGNHAGDFLACRYSAPGNVIGEPPFE